MASTIKLKNGSGAPTSGQLVQGEPAFDLTNKRLYTENASGTVIEVGTNPSSLTIGGTALTATAAELNTLDGITATTAELNYTDGVTSNIQTQLNTKAPIASPTFTGTVTAPAVNVNGTVTADGASVTGDAYVQTADGASAFYITRYGTITAESAKFHVDDNDLIIDSIQDEQFGGFTFKSTYSGTGTRNRLDIANNGDISFYEDTGTTAKFFWDASAESLGIGTSSPSWQFHCLTSGAQFPTFETADGNDVAINLVQTGVNTFTIGYDDSQDLLKVVRGTASSTTGIGIDSSGNVGIGTTSPVADSGYSSVTLDGSTGSQLFLRGAGTDRGLVWASTNFNIEAKSTTPMVFRTNATEAMRIDASGNVGIACTPDTALNAFGYKVLEVAGANTTKSGALLLSNSSGTDFGQIYADNSDGWKFVNGQATKSTIFYGGSGAAERMRIDSSGNLLVGKTAGSVSTAGHDLYADGLAYHVRNGGICSVHNRLTSDGDIAVFRKDDTTVGSIGVASSYLTIGSPVGSGGHLLIGNNLVHPATSTGASKDASIDIGGSSNRFKDLYLSGGVYLGGTGAANKLDDYEEGTWTPTLVTGGWTLDGLVRASYTKIGNTVHVRCYTGVSGTGNTASLVLGGLPFTANTNSFSTGIANLQKSLYAGTYARVEATTTTVGFYASAESTSTNLIEIEGTDIGSGYIIFSVTYETT